MILQNKRVLHDYEIIEKIEAGIVLKGWEVKSIRAHAANLKSAWVRLRNGESYLENFSISPWRFANHEQDKDRPKKLLLKKKEIIRLEQKTKKKNLTITPLSVFDNNGKLKCEIVLVRGRKKYEKRQILKDRTMAKEAKKAMRKF